MQRLSVVPFAKGPKRSMGHLLGAEKIIFFFNSRPMSRHGPMAGAPVESCQSLPKQVSPWGRLGSVLYTCKRLHRMRRRFKHFWPISLSSHTELSLGHDLLQGLRIREH